MTAEAQPAAQALADVVRREWPRVVATLVRVTGDLPLAEDAAQDAAIEALTAWDKAIPDKPTAWIMTVARRRAIDRIRREATGRRKSELLASLEAWNQSTIDDPANDITGLETNLRDDQLRLVFGCCHPALSVEAQVALTLRSIAGLTTAEIARSFLVAEATMAQRLVRAKRKISRAGIPFVLPPDSELLQRLESVHRVIYLVFNEGYAATSGDDFVRHELCNEAVRLAKLLAELVPDDAETLSLLALMFATHARSAARVNAIGEPVLLEDQDRATWDHDAIATAEQLLDRAMRLRAGGALQIQAAIAVLHGTAPDSASTDWKQIEVLYRLLMQRDPTPVVKLNHAVAIAMADEPAAGLVALDDDDLRNALSNYRYFHAARADLLAKVGYLDQATEAYNQAIALDGADGETALLRRKRDALQDL